MITNKTILLISPLNKTGGKASFTNLLVDALKRNKINFYHIDLIRAASKNKIIWFFEHIYSFIYFKVKFVWILVTRKIDIVQIHTSTRFDFWDLSLFVIISKAFKKKTIVRYGGSAFPRFYESSTRLQKSYIRWVLRMYDILIVQSIYWKNFFSLYGVEKKRMFLLPNFVDITAFKFNTKKHAQNKTHILFMPASSLKGKGFFDVKDKILVLAHNNPHIIFHITGPEVKKHIQGFNIMIYDKIYGKQKLQLFSLCSIFLLPTHNEGFPNALLEAMASGMSIITTNIPQINCLVKDGKECLLMTPGASIEFKDKLQQLIKDRVYAKQLGINARKLVEKKYSSDKIDEYLRSLYNG